MRIVHQVDAFREPPYLGNPAGVCILPEPENEPWMQEIATKMGLSETAFVTPRRGGDFDLRWFTPTSEVALCGHATLASAHVLWEQGILLPSNDVRFHTRSGLLVARKDGQEVLMDFPSKAAISAEPPAGLIEALDVNALFIGRSQYDYLVEVATADEVRGAVPDFAALRALPVRGIILTSRSDEARFDFVSRFFAPAVGVDEDPVTGSAHCTLAPFWAQKLGKRKFTACQLSERGGVLKLLVNDDRVQLGGKALTTGQRVF